MRILLTLALLLLAATSHAQACRLRTTDITLELKATAGSPTIMTTSRYGAGNEAVRRYTLTYVDGSMIMLEQQDCTDSNLRITLMSLHEKPTLLELNRMAAVLSTTTMWRNFFSGASAATLLQAEVASEDFTTRLAKSSRFFYGADSRIFAPSARSNASVGFMQGNTATQFRSLFTLALGVSGGA